MKFGLSDHNIGQKFGLIDQIFINECHFTTKMDRERLKEALLEHNQQKLTSNFIPRELQQKLDEHAKSEFVIIVSGIRRSGKSTILTHLRQQLDSYYVNFDDERLIDFTVKDFVVLYELLQELFGEKDTFIFDEIQNIPAWERFVRRLHNEKKKVYVTGSNASMLSRELGTHLTGRHISLTMYPFSFREFCSFHKMNFDLLTLTSSNKAKIKRLFAQYLKQGGFPEFLRSEKIEYLKSLYENILYRDIITRYNIPNEKPLKLTATYAARNVGKELSFNQIKKLTGLSSATTVKEYFSYLENSYLCFLISRYDDSLKKQIYYAKKAYYIDPAIASLLGFHSSEDYGRILENIVFIDLMREKKEIYFHKGKYECDFVLRQGTKIVQAIQVTKVLGKNKDRELQGLLEAMKRYKLKKGLILTKDQSETFVVDKKKIEVKPVWKWLLTKSKGDQK